MEYAGLSNINTWLFAWSSTLKILLTGVLLYTLMPVSLNWQPLLSSNGLCVGLVLSYRTTGEKASKVTKFKAEGSEPSLGEEKLPSEIASIL